MSKLKLLTLSGLLLLGGCKTISYENAAGRHLVYQAFGTDTKIGKLVIHTPEGSIVELENYDSNTDKSMDTLNNAIQRIPVPSATPFLFAPVAPTPAGP